MQMGFISGELERTKELYTMLNDNVSTYCQYYGRAGGEYPKNHNASKTAILNQITTLRNELLVLADIIRA